MKEKSREEPRVPSQGKEEPKNPEKQASGAPKKSQSKEDQAKDASLGPAPSKKFSGLCKYGTHCPDYSKCQFVHPNDPNYLEKVIQFKWQNLLPCNFQNECQRGASCRFIHPWDYLLLSQMMGYAAQQ